MLPGHPYGGYPYGPPGYPVPAPPSAGEPPPPGYPPPTQTGPYYGSGYTGYGPSAPPPGGQPPRAGAATGGEGAGDGTAEAKSCLKRKLSGHDGRGGVTSPGGGGANAGGSGAMGGGQGHGSKDDRSKRAKTPRACDSCRRKKIRCDAIEGNEPPLCNHCKQHGFDCTWFLPIAETRFKRKREHEDSATAATSSLAQGRGVLPPPPPKDSHPVNAPLPFATPPLSAGHIPSQGGPFGQTSRGPPQAGGAGNANAAFPRAASVAANGQSPASSSHDSKDGEGRRRNDPRVYGSTSISYLMHSTTSFPAERMGAYDHKYFQKLEAWETGDGVIKVFMDRKSSDNAEGTDPDGMETDREGGPEVIRVPPLPNGHSGLAIPPQVAEQLVNYFFTHLVQLYPIITREDFLSSVPLSPLVFYSICGVSALHHSVAPEYRKALREVMVDIHRSNELLCQSDLGTIQSLLLYTWSLEFERTRQGSLTWNALGTAIRMAQGLGLHRETASDADRADDHAELRRRVWGGCIIADRWVAAMYGLPQMIDLSDCDRLFPSVHEIRPGRDVNTEHKPFIGFSPMMELSIVLGRVLKLLYTPTGILHVTDEQANALNDDLDAWRDHLPPECRFDGSNPTLLGGYLLLYLVPVRFLLYRPFMRISYSCPDGLKFCVSVDQFNALLADARGAIHYCNQHDAILEGYPVALYSLFICCLIQYHSYVRRRDEPSLCTLGLARDTLGGINSADCSTRNKVAEIVSLLYSTASSVKSWSGDACAPPTFASIANPTVGVRPRVPDASLRWRSNGKPIVGHFETDDDKNILPGLVLRSNPNSPAAGAGAGATPSSGAQPSPATKASPSTGPPVAPPEASLEQQQQQPQEELLPPQPQPQAQQDEQLGAFASGVNLNPAMNTDPVSMSNATGAIDFFGEAMTNAIFPTDPSGFDSWLFSGPGLDFDFARGLS